MLLLFPPNAVLTSDWLKEQGYSLSLMQKYINTGWFERIGEGAFKRKGATVGIMGGLWALSQNITTYSSIRIGGRSALELQGFGHNVTMTSRPIFLFCARKQIIPKWFTKVVKDQKFTVIRTSCFKNIDYHKQDIQDIEVPISSPEQAILEACYLAPEWQDLEELSHLMASLTSLRPSVVQDLLEQCTSVKTKRLFLFLARKYNHAWFENLDERKINLGQGRRYLVHGKLDQHYQITLPREWFDAQYTPF